MVPDEILGVPGVLDSGVSSYKKEKNLKVKLNVLSNLSNLHDIYFYIYLEVEIWLLGTYLEFIFSYTVFRAKYTLQRDYINSK